MIEGACHCGAIHWQFDGLPDGATACNCTVCRRYGALWAYDYEGEGIRVSLRLTEPEPIAKVPIDHFDGLDKYDDLPRDGRCVADHWF